MEFDDDDESALINKENSDKDYKLHIWTFKTPIILF
jgi:hypothetical protein